MSGDPPVPFNVDLVERLRGHSGVDIAGSLYAVPEHLRGAAARLLARHGLWIHADVFADAHIGVSLDLINDLAERGTGPIDVHLLTAGALDALPSVCRPGVARVTFPFEGTADVEAVAARVRLSGASPWLAIAPGTSVDDCHAALSFVDGLLVMLIEPGTRGGADLTQLAKVTAAGARCPVGVDGGVGEANVQSTVDAGASYLVIGRRLFAVSHGNPAGSPR